MNKFFRIKKFQILQNRFSKLQKRILYLILIKQNQHFLYFLSFLNVLHMRKENFKFGLCASMLDEPKFDFMPSSIAHNTKYISPYLQQFLNVEILQIIRKVTMNKMDPCFAASYYKLVLLYCQYCQYRGIEILNFIPFHESELEKEETKNEMYVIL